MQTEVESAVNKESIVFVDGCNILAEMQETSKPNCVIICSVFH
jgi:hypothetical protein